MSTLYHAKRRIACPWCCVPESATIPPNVPASILRRWLKDGLIARGRGDKTVDFVEDTGRVGEEDDFDEDGDVDLDNPEEFPIDDDGLEDIEDDDEQTVPAPADRVKPAKPKPARKAAPRKTK